MLEFLCTEPAEGNAGALNDYLAISQVRDILPFESQSQAKDEIADLIVLVQAGIVLPFYIQDFATKRKNGLKASIPGLLCTST